jgi:transposase-like protein
MWGEIEIESVEYAQGFREQMVRKMLPPTRMAATALAKDSGVAQSTLSRWLRDARTVAPVVAKKATRKGSGKWTAAEKLRVVAEAMKLGESELGELLRREGLHEAQLRQWRTDAEAGLVEVPRKGRRSPEAVRIRELDGRRRRQGRGSVGVVLKKAAEIWGWGQGNGTNRKTGRS